MKFTWVGMLIPAILTAAAVTTLALWLGRDPTSGFTPRLSKPERFVFGDKGPGGDRDATNPTSHPSGAAGMAAGTLTRGPGAAATSPAPTQEAEWPGNWPQFRGPNRDGIGSTTAALAHAWPAKGPKVLWTVKAGEGYAGPAVQGGHVYLMDYDREKQADTLRCLSLADGQEIWRYAYPLVVKRNHGMSRTVPAVAEGCVVAIGPKCQTICLDALTGQFKWAVDQVGEYPGAVVPEWYTGQCPLIDSGKVILAPGGDAALLIAVDLKTGQKKWASPNPHKWKSSHASVLPLTVDGQKMYVYFAHGGLVGVSADDGAVLWEMKTWKMPLATVPSPVDLGGGRLFLSLGYECGAAMVQVHRDGGGAWSVREVYRLAPRVFGATQHGPVLYQDHLYGIRPTSNNDGELVCLDLAGKVLWSVPPEGRFGSGGFLVSGGLMYVLGNSGDADAGGAEPGGIQATGQGPGSRRA